MKLTGLVVAAGLSLLTVGAAQAMPVAPTPASDAGAAITLVRDGCGFGMHRGPWGQCRYNRGWRGAERRYYAPPRRFCPPGTHRIPRTGVCRRNYY